MARRESLKSLKSFKSLKSYPTQSTPQSTGIRQQPQAVSLTSNLPLIYLRFTSNLPPIYLRFTSNLALIQVQGVKGGMDAIRRAVGRLELPR